MAQTPPPSGGAGPAPENFPGFDYLERVSGAAHNTIVANGRALTDAWNLMRGGSWDVPTAAKMWAQMVDNYSNVVEELWRVPNIPRQPTWVIIPFSLSDSAKSSEFRLSQPLDAGTTLEATAFAALGTGTIVTNMLAQAPQVSGTHVEIELSQAALAQLTAGTSYLGFIVRTDASAGPPLAIVVIRVKP